MDMMPHYLVNHDKAPRPGLQSLLQTEMQSNDELEAMMAMTQETGLPPNMHEFIQRITRVHPLAKIPFYSEYSFWAWVAFGGGLITFMLLDLGVFHRTSKAMSFGTALLAMIFWVSVGLLYNLYIFATRGFPAAMLWFNGFVLEWALSLDNLFVFYLVFAQYKTPEEQKYKALFYGIMGAILLRLFFFSVGEVLFETLGWVKIVFGLFLIYTGIRTALEGGEDEEFDANKNYFVKVVSSVFPLIPRYGPNAEFFVRDDGSLSAADNATANKKQDEEHLPRDTALLRRAESVQTTRSTTGLLHRGRSHSQPNLMLKATPPKTGRWKATLLFLVVCALEGIDIVFAVDSTSAKLAAIPDIFLAYTSTVLAMFGLRACFFLVDEIVHYFELMKYGLCVILVFVGLKLMFSRLIHVSNFVTCIVLLSTLTLTIAVSVLWKFYTVAAVDDDDVLRVPDTPGLKGGGVGVEPSSARSLLLDPHQRDTLSGDPDLPPPPLHVVRSKPPDTRASRDGLNAP